MKVEVIDHKKSETGVLMFANDGIFQLKNGGIYTLTIFQCMSVLGTCIRLCFIKLNIMSGSGQYKGTVCHAHWDDEQL